MSIKTQFATKRYTLRAITRKACPLTSGETRCWSYLAQKAKHGRPITPSRIAKATGLDRGRAGRGVTRHLDHLSSLGLAEATGDGYVAKEPAEERVGWFVWKDKPGAWWRRIALYPVFTLANRKKVKGSKAQITPAANDLYWLLVSLSRGKPEVKGQTFSRPGGHAPTK